MPKIVDHEARREEIAQALWRVVRRDGLRAASVRTIAAEAGWSAGSVRYYFPDQAGLLNFAMDLVSRRVGDRISALQPEGEPLELAQRYLDEVLPLDSERQAEFDVWLSFIAQALSESGASELREHIGTVQGGLRGLCKTLLDHADESGVLREGLDLATEVDRLHALVDGLAVHLAVQPRHTTPELARRILRDHLKTLLQKA